MARKRRTYTPEFKAEAAGVPVGTLRGSEQGRRRPSIDAADRVAHALGITVDELIGDAFTQSPESKPEKKEKRGRKKTASDHRGCQGMPGGAVAGRRLPCHWISSSCLPASSSAFWFFILGPTFPLASVQGERAQGPGPRLLGHALDPVPEADRGAGRRGG